MEKGIEAEEDNLYKATDNVAENVLSKFDGLNPNINSYANSNPNSIQNIDYDKLFNIIFEAFKKALTNCKFTLDDDGFARIVKEELYKAV